MSDYFSIQRPVAVTSTAHLVHMAAGTAVLFTASAYVINEVADLHGGLTLLIALIISVFYPTIGDSFYKGKERSWESQARAQLAELGYIVPPGQSFLEILQPYGYGPPSGKATLINRSGKAQVYHVHLKDERLVFRRMEWIQPTTVTTPKNRR